MIPTTEYFFFIMVISLNNDETSVRGKTGRITWLTIFKLRTAGWFMTSAMNWEPAFLFQRWWGQRYLKRLLPRGHRVFFLAQNTWWSKFSLNRRVELTLQVAYFSYQDVYRRNLAGLVYLYLSPSFYGTWIQQTLCSPYMSYTALPSKCAACSFVDVYC